MLSQGAEVEHQNRLHEPRFAQSASPGDGVDMRVDKDALARQASRPAPLGRERRERRPGPEEGEGEDADHHWAWAHAIE